MEWMTNAFWAHVGWAVADAAIGMVALIAVGFLTLMAMAPRLIRHARCSHARFHETSACDAICLDCGKNLGFIGSWRSKHLAE